MSKLWITIGRDNEEDNERTYTVKLSESIQLFPPAHIESTVKNEISEKGSTRRNGMWRVIDKSGYDVEIEESLSG